MAARRGAKPATHRADKSTPPKALCAHRNVPLSILGVAEHHYARNRGYKDTAVRQADAAWTCPAPYFFFARAASKVFAFNGSMRW